MSIAPYLVYFWTHLHGLLVPFLKSKQNKVHFQEYIILLTFIYMVCVYPVNVYKYNGVNGTTKTGHRQLSMKQ